MKLLKNIDQILIGWGVSPQAAMAVDEFIAFALILLLAFVADAICRKVLLKVIARIVKQTKATWDELRLSSICAFLLPLPVLLPWLLFSGYASYISLSPFCPLSTLS